MRYRVSYSDVHYPEIVQCEDVDGLSFAKAKAELVKYATYKREHWAEVVKNARATNKHMVDKRS